MDYYHMIAIFIAFYGSFTESKECDQILTELEGSFTSPNFPDKYPANSNCKYKFMAPPNHVIEIKFKSFFVEKSFSFLATDFVQVQDGRKGSTVTTYSGKLEPFTIISTRERMIVKFVSDETFNLKGFNATYKMTPKRPCSLADVNNLQSLNCTFAENSETRVHQCTCDENYSTSQTGRCNDSVWERTPTCNLLPDKLAACENKRREIPTDFLESVGVDCVGCQARPCPICKKRMPPGRSPTALQQQCGIHCKENAAPCRLYVYLALNSRELRSKREELKILGTNCYSCTLNSCACAQLNGKECIHTDLFSG